MPTTLRPELPPEIDEVFGRVLAKRPDERYGSCREFVEAARIAMGIYGSGTESSFAYGATTAGPQTDAPPGSRAGTPPDQFSWSNVASRAHSAGPGDGSGRPRRAGVRAFGSGPVLGQPAQRGPGRLRSARLRSAWLRTGRLWSARFRSARRGPAGCGSARRDSHLPPP